MPENFDFFFKKGKEMLSKRAYPDAITAFKKALKFDKNNAEVYHYLGEASSNSDNDVGAIESFNKSIELNPKKSNSYASLSKIYDKQGNIDEAIISMKIAIELDPKNYSYYEQIGDLYFKKSLITEGIESYNKAIQFSKDVEPFLRSIFSKRLAEHNLIDDAITQAELARKHIPNYLNYWPLCDLYILKGDEIKAIELFEKAIFEEHTGMMDLKKYIALLKGKNDIKKIEEILKKSAISYPSIHDSNPKITDDDARYDLGKLLLEYGCFNEAQTFFESSIQLYPERYDFGILLGASLLKMGFYEEAMREFESIIRAHIYNEDIFYDIYNIMVDHSTDDYSESYKKWEWGYAQFNGVELFKKIQAENPDNAAVKNILGLLNFDLGSFDNAIQHFADTVKTAQKAFGFEDSPYFHMNLADALIESEENSLDFTDWAIQEYREALKLDKENYDARSKLIRLLQKKGDNTTALNECIEGLNLFPQDVSLNFLYAIELAKKGKFKESMDIFRNQIKKWDKTPLNVKSYYREWAEVFLQKEYFNEAEEIARYGLNNSNQKSSDYDILGKILMKQGKLEKTVSLFKSQIEQNVNGGHFNLAEIYFTNSKFDEAIPYYKKDIEQNSYHFEAHKRLAEIYAKKGLIQEAVNEYTAIMDLHPGDPTTYENYKNLFLKKVEREAIDKKTEIQSKDVDEKITAFEKKIREFIGAILKAKYGENYWEKIKFDQKEEIEQRINDDLLQNPHLDKGDINPLDYFGVSDYSKIILSQWDVFEKVFRSRQELKGKFLQISRLRNSIKHVRTVSSPTIMMGMGSVEWFDLIIDKWQKMI